MRNNPVTGIFSKTPTLLTLLLFGAMILSACAAPAAATPAPPTGPQATSSPAETAPPANSPYPAPTEAPAAPSEALPPEAQLSAATHPTLGQMLVGENGMSLYMFARDTADTSYCDAACMEKWPPLLTRGQPVLGEGVDPALVSSATLADGSMIVTYNHMPLYYWYMDLNAGDTGGQGVSDAWFVVGPDGSPIGMGGANAGGNANANINDNANDNDNSNTAEFVEIAQQNGACRTPRGEKVLVA